MRHRACAIVLPALLAACAAAHADVDISTAATVNMTCSDGVCAPTARHAVLNVTDLENLLASGNVTVTTTGSGVQAGNLDVNAAVSWAGSNALALDAHQSITVGQPVVIGGLGGLSLTTNDGGKDGLLLFLGKGNVSFTNPASSLVIDGNTYALISTLPALAAAIAANPSGAYALANSYDASQDGTYSNAPIPTGFYRELQWIGQSDFQPGDRRYGAIQRDRRRAVFGDRHGGNGGKHRRCQRQHRWSGKLYCRDCGHQ
jgi:CubicO group peptidase (beta-lactamase class C family)